jgi:hypothetical protein
MRPPQPLRCVASPLRPTHSSRTRGKQGTPHRHPSAPPRRRAHKRKGHGTDANDRLPIISVVSRQTGEHRFGGGARADTQTCHRLIADNVPAGGPRLYTDAWPSYQGSHTFQATVRHGRHEWARADADEGRREVHCNTCEGAGAALRTYLRAFRGVHQRSLHLYVAT